MLAAIRLPLPPMGSASPMMRRSASAVPSNATALVQEVHANGAHKAAFYLAAGRIVAYRQWRDTGQVELEYALRDGVKHGKEYHFYADGRLRAEETYYRGKRHGVGRQWSARGRLLVQWRLTQGVGRSLWCDPETGLLSEEQLRPPKQSPGYVRHWNLDQCTICQEYFFLLGKGYHGICREWDAQGRLRRGFPRFFVRGRRVSKGQYLAACLTRRALPPYCREDDDPHRQLPCEYVSQRKRRDRPRSPGKSE